MDDFQQRFSAGFFSASGSGSPPKDGASNETSPPDTNDETPPTELAAAEIAATDAAESDAQPPPAATPQDWSVSSGFWNPQPAERSLRTNAPHLPIIHPLTPPSADDLQAADIPEESTLPAATPEAGILEIETTEAPPEPVVHEPFAEAPDLSVQPLPEPLPIPPPASPTPQQTPSEETLHQPNAEVAQLRAENRQLYEHIAQMEELLQECQATLELQMMRSQTQESLIERQTQELEETHQALQQTQTEADRILTELEKSGDILQRQAQELAIAQQLAATLQGTLEDTQREVSRYQVVVETLTQELDNSQTRITHLEETCHQLQQRSLNQDAAIAQTEANCQELQARLNRQQRQTLHFRSALERCLDLNLTSELPDADAPLQLPQGSIQPWSVDTAPDDPNGESTASAIFPPG
ncbi:MAG: hypothetical protein AAGF75_11230, partial [Cyanobacteria bacterium P01_H01_bin.130]